MFTAGLINECIDDVCHCVVVESREQARIGVILKIRAPIRIVSICDKGNC